MNLEDKPLSSFPMTRRHWLEGAVAGIASGLPASGLGQILDERRLRRSEIYYGRQEPSAAWMEFRAGPLTLVFEPDLAFVRYVRLDNREVMRGIYSAVRDRNWGTIAPQVTNLKAVRAGTSFQLTFDVLCREGPCEFFWKGRLSGSEDGTLRFEMDGAARSTFLRNRIGFCVLHPITECAGQPCVIEHVDGRREEGKFPDLISPHQPFFGIRAISHQVIPGVTAEVRFDGEVFETEDQRNWTDASYKTYCTPLALPFPVEVPKGTRISQSVTLRLKGTPPSPRKRIRPAGVSLSATDAPALPLPKIGVIYAPESPPPTARQIERLRAIGLSHIRVDLKLAEDTHGKLLRHAGALGKELDVPLEIAVFVGENAEDQLSDLAGKVEKLTPAVARWLVYDSKQQLTTPGLLSLAGKYLKGPVGGGANTNFTELNRNRPETPPDVVCYAVNPQVHAHDNASLVETFEGLRDTVRSARAFAGDSALAVTAVTLKQQFNPVATGEPVEATPNFLPSSVDERQMSLFGAGWTLGSLQALCESGVESLTYYETTGWRGVMELDEGPAQSDLFRSIPGTVFPLYHVLADVQEFSGGNVIPVNVSRPLEVAGMMLRRGESRRVLLANVSGDLQYVRIAAPGLKGHWRARLLDEYNVEHAMSDSEGWREAGGSLLDAAEDFLAIALLPYAYARLDYAS